MDESGIMVSFDVETAAPDDELDFPLAAMALVALLRMDASASALFTLVEASAAVVTLVAEVEAVVVVAFVDAAPFADPPDVLM
jgi:hypothetical protein